MIVAVDGSGGAVEGCVGNMVAVLMAARLLLVMALVTVGVIDSPGDVMLMMAEVMVLM